MTPTKERRAPLLAIGLFFGTLLGVGLTLALTHRDTSETYKEYRERVSGRPFRPGMAQGAPSQPNPGTRPGVTQPPAMQGQDEGHTSGEDGAREQIAKVHFMKKFVAALTQVPDNSGPQTEYRPLLKEGAEPISCRDCHTSSTIDFERMKQLDPGEEAVEPFRNRRMWMIQLMTAWVGRLNQLHADRLTGEVTCTSCHEIDPRDMRTLTRVYPSLMVRFVNALKEPPKNKQPASNWKPLLKDPENGSLMCGTWARRWSRRSRPANTTSRSPSPTRRTRTSWRT